MVQLLADIKSLAELVGELPVIDAVPSAWYMSTDPEVLAGHDQWAHDYKVWYDQLTELMEFSGFRTPNVRFGGWGGEYLIGFYVDKEPPQWWRKDKKGYIVPRVRTVAERNSEVNQRFRKIQKIPRAINYLPGIPKALFMPGEEPGEKRVFWPQVCRPAEAVLVFLGADPDLAADPFVVDEQWQRMKMSTYHLLAERQAAADGE